MLNNFYFYLFFHGLKMKVLIVNWNACQIHHTSRLSFRWSWYPLHFVQFFLTLSSTISSITISPSSNHVCSNMVLLLWCDIEWIISIWGCTRIGCIKWWCWMWFCWRGSGRLVVVNLILLQVLMWLEILYAICLVEISQWQVLGLGVHFSIH